MVKMKFPYSAAKNFGFSTASITVFIFIVYTLLHLFTVNIHFLSVNSEKPANPTSIRYNPWLDLSISETESLLHYLHTVPNNLNLSSPGSTDPFQNYVLRTELLRPNKSQFLSFVDEGSHPKPPRWASVLVYHGADGDVTLDEYSVGPLPPSPETEIRPLTFYHNSAKSTSPNLVPDSMSLKDWPYSIARDISDITQSLFGSTINFENSSSPNGLELTFRDPWIDSDGRNVRWCVFQGAGKRWGANTLLPQGLYLKIDTTGRDSTQWKVIHWFYNNVLYNSTEEFRAAWMSPGFVITPPNLDGEWTHVDDAANFDRNPKQHSTTLAADSEKEQFALDKEQKFVSWQGFEFHMAFSQATGLTLYDVRFQGERFIYELGLQEALSHYAGRDPVQGAAKYLDSFWGMGATMFELVPGTSDAHSS